MALCYYDIDEFGYDLNLNNDLNRPDTKGMTYVNSVKLLGNTNWPRGTHTNGRICDCMYAVCTEKLKLCLPHFCSSQASFIIKKEKQQEFIYRGGMLSCAD